MTSCIATVGMLHQLHIIIYLIKTNAKQTNEIQSEKAI